MADGDKLNVDSIISRLLEGEKIDKFIFIFYSFTLWKFQFLLLVRGARPGKAVQLAEHEIRNLCIKSREMFLSLFYWN